MTSLHEYNSPLGEILLTSDGKNLTGLYFKDSCGKIPGEYKELPIFDDAVKWLDVYFSGKAPDFTPAIKITGSDFQKEVSRVMLAIPFGQVMTYADIAKEIARVRKIPSMSAQAVGGAAARNNISLIIPCHRVIGAKGNLTGYGGGLERKRKLLELEGYTL